MSKKIRTMSIRIISLISCVMVLISCLVFSAAATETDTSAYHPNFINLLDYAVQYQIDGYRNGVLLGTQYGFDPIATVGSAGTTLKFTWGDQNNRLALDGLYVGITSNAKPTSVVLWNNELTYCGKLGDIYYYRKAGELSTYAHPILEVTSSAAGSISITTCLAWVNLDVSLSKIEFKAYGQFESDGQYYYQTIQEDEQIAPFTFYKTYGSHISAPSQLWTQLTIDFPVPVADYISFTFASASITPNQWQESQFTSGGIATFVNGTTQESLQYDLSHTIASGNYNGYPIYIYTVNVDLRGYDLYDSTLYLRLPLMRYKMNQDINSQGVFYHFQFLNCNIKNTTFAKPWYVRFYYWIRDEFTDLKETINSAFGVGQATPDISDQQQEIEDSVTGMDDIGDEIDSSRQEMDELMPQMPSWEDTGLEGFDSIVVSYIQQFHPLFIAIYDNNIINQILTYTFLFALGGFILFGER